MTGDQILILAILGATLALFLWGRWRHERVAMAAVMAPVALGAAARLEANPDTFLFAVAIGTSCAFLTPIGHQNNTLILGRSGFRFGDDWRLGLPLEQVVIAVTLPALLLFWPP